jgi:hypothetical protein
MTSASVVPLPTSLSRTTDPTGSTVPSDVVEELCTTLFSSFRRKDQRQKATQYLRGLLTTQGRKSIRNIAATTGGPAAVQSLHHFIASSTWDWQPLRAALAAYAESVAPPQAWVVRPMSVSKAGTRSVGVDEIVDPCLGQTFWGQQSFGVWSVSPRLSVPINWRLFLPGRRGRADIRSHRDEAAQNPGETLQDCAVAAALTTPYRREACHTPVVLNIRGSATPATMARFAAASVPVLARATASSRLVVADRAVPGSGRRVLPAQAILQSVGNLRRPVQWLTPGQPHVLRRSLVVAVPVMLPHVPAGQQRPLLLLGVWRDPRQPPVQSWLTDMVQVPESRLMKLIGLSHKVDWDASRTGEAVGLRDFVGRSFRGWHRHITLASVAHAARMVTADADRASYGALPAPA